MGELQQRVEGTEIALSAIRSRGRLNDGRLICLAEATYEIPSPSDAHGIPEQADWALGLLGYGKRTVQVAYSIEVTEDGESYIELLKIQ